MEEYVSEHDEAQLIIDIFGDINKKIIKIEGFYGEYDDLIGHINFETIEKETIEQFQAELDIEKNSCNREEFEDQIMRFMSETEEDYERLPDCLYVGEDIEIPNLSHNALLLKWNDYELTPVSAGTHTVYLQLINSSELIAESCIEITYGYMCFDEDGNAADGCESDIEIDFHNVIKALDCVREDYEEFIIKHEHILSLIKNFLLTDNEN